MWLMQSIGERLLGAVDRLQRAFHGSPPAFRRGAAMLVDAFIVIESFAVVLIVRVAGDVEPQFWQFFWPFAIFSAIAFVLLLNESGVYRSILRYTGIYQGVQVLSATAIAAGGLFLAVYCVGPGGFGLTEQNPVPLSVPLMGSVLAYVQLVAVRLYPRVFYELSLREVGRRTRIVIVGTGEPGVALAGHIWRTSAAETQVVGFVSESRAEVGRQIEGASVLGFVEDLEGVISQHGVDQVIIAMPQASREQMDQIWRTSTQASATVKVMPDLGEFLSEGTIKLRELQIEDLLGREPVDIDLEALSGYVNGKRVLVTGAAGSIGSELSRQISRLGPAQLVLLDRDESGLYYLNAELRREDFYEAETSVGDVTNPERVSFIFEKFRPQLVFHAAAYKHVPMMELQAAECITNNVFGTLNVARAAGAYGASKFVNVSTDKAVHPANVMGATKRLAEMIVKNLSAEYPQTVYASVRFGNVLGSRGSVVPTFRQQIEAGGPVTVTHPDMIRYFMTIPEAVSLILQAGAMAEGYGTYVLEMGRPVAITDLARKMIEIMGAPNIKIKFVGLRPGEKLREELFEEDDERTETDHQMVFRLVSENMTPPDGSELSEVLDPMISHARNQEAGESLALLSRAVPNYSADGPEARETNLNYPPKDW
ncbi:MAG: UDP-N-acetylglucosamine 4,6-dehydratase [uncultured Rubrobacteraceae bacterium]|uniref:UDP-N-acetylglucosamine 4,6-dehydratase n=1 Tax=uncultured Rubrobacteraceae bacterium TaxID=349277 RepID=A0A6J4RQ83_9ACTN|nr:MAG: UDP-N-acetylglucosamine 4,6-dehydratase [uncultured Rubrobacteraceae bacterium]